MIRRRTTGVFGPNLLKKRREIVGTSKLNGGRATNGDTFVKTELPIPSSSLKYFRVHFGSIG